MLTRHIAARTCYLLRTWKIERTASVVSKRFLSGGADITLEERSQKFLGNRPVSWTHQLSLVREHTSLPIYRVLDSAGNHVSAPADDFSIDSDLCLRIMREMILLSIMDKILYDSQRQGRISFYMTNIGEEACQIASAAALDASDVVFAQYREAGVLLHRGFSLQQAMDQCYGNVDDIGRSKQMPVHYGSSALNFVTISSPLSTQMPQSVGAAYSLKLHKKPSIAVCYFGDGAASEGDAHAAFNFAATLNCPILFICRNNGYAISTPVHEQYAGDGIAGHGHGYGMASVRVDGNDVQAVFNAVKLAREHILAENAPVLMEVMTYRSGHHSTSDDSTAYRSVEEIKFWEQHAHPIHIWKNHLIKRGLMTEEDMGEMQKDARKSILKAFAVAEKKLKPKVLDLFGDVYKELPTNLGEQSDALRQHLDEYGQNYPMDQFTGS